ncbi:hypothetical protein DSI96_06070, partial [Mycobacterium tuberculosis]
MFLFARVPPTRWAGSSLTSQPCSMTARVATTTLGSMPQGGRHRLPGRPQADTTSMGAFLVAEVPVGGPSSDRCWVDGRRCVAKVYGVGGQEEVDGWA